MKSAFLFVACTLALGAKAKPRSELLGLTLQLQTGISGLNLQKSASPIFQDNFKVLLSEMDSQGQTVFQDVTPSMTEINKIESSIFTDPVANAAVRVKIVDGVTQMFGVINGSMLSYDAAKDRHILNNKLANQKLQFDYLEVPKDELSNDVPIFVNRSVDAVVTPELLIVLDNINYVHFSENTALIAEYLAIFVKSVNNRYTTSSDPRITLKISGIVLMGTTGGQPFIENNQAPDGSYLSSPILADFATFLASNPTFPSFDLGALITGVNMVTVAGLAYRGANCNSKSRVSLSNDNNGLFDGVQILAHEIGHNLGAPHDGDAASGTGDCTNESGYLMSTNGGVGTLNSFYFSPCSKTKINTHLGTSNANCFYTDEASSHLTPSPLLPGDRVQILDVCRSYRPDAYVSDTHTPDELCLNMRCKYNAPCPPPNENLNCIWTVTLNREAPEGAACGNGGKCFTGRCV